MQYVLIGGKEIPAKTRRYLADADWNGRESWGLEMEISAAEVAELFVNDAAWSLRLDQEPEEKEPLVQDMSAYSVAGPIKDLRDGRVIVRMGKPTEEELLTVLTGGRMTMDQARTARNAIETGAASLSDKEASTVPGLSPCLRQDGKLIRAGSRINWKGHLKRAAADLWDTEENNPENAPNLWEDVSYIDGIRMIPEIITAGLAFAAGELGWWNGEVYKNVLGTVNTYNPDVYPEGWKKVPR